MKYAKLYGWLDEKCAAIEDAELAKLFRSCFLSTLTTTVKEQRDGSVYVSTGDIPAMWLRDSSAQVEVYARLCGIDEDVRALIRGVLRRQFFYIGIDPYANAFNEEANGRGHKDITLRNDWVWERKFEIDSLCYPMRLAEKYYEYSGDASVFDESFRETARTVLRVFETEQDHAARSDYSFLREGEYSQDSLENGGKGGYCKQNGLVWSAFRPSDDRNRYGYLIPANMFIVSVMRFLRRVFTEIVAEPELAARCAALAESVERGLAACAAVPDGDGGMLYAYETDGAGNAFVADDANLPSLLSVPYFGYGSTGDAVYRNTRRHILSRKNRYYYEGAFAKGVGSPHTPENHIWPLALLAQGLTAESDGEKLEILGMLATTHNGTYHMHESFDKDDPSRFTRAWFGWADSLFAEYFLQNFELFRKYRVKTKK